MNTFSTLLILQVLAAHLFLQRLALLRVYLNSFLPSFLPGYYFFASLPEGPLAFALSN